ncbi:uncharacterized protein METZ01_LOCUS159491 [marine metagenome]|uniref:Uncharacterized protein n=1 Tax=marine metagenome TaxID=408172 RepID=A0A382B095_9ZZZZ
MKYSNQSFVKLHDLNENIEGLEISLNT